MSMPPEFTGVRVERGLPTGDRRAQLLDGLADALGIPEPLRHLPGRHAAMEDVQAFIDDALHRHALDFGAAMERQALREWADNWDVPLSALCEAHANGYGLAYFPDIIRGLR